MSHKTAKVADDLKRLRLSRDSVVIVSWDEVDERRLATPVSLI